MGGVTPASYQTLDKFVRSVGCRFERQKGSHRIYWRDDLVRPVVIPTYKDVPPFIIRNILRQLKVSVEDYHQALHEL